MNDFDPDIRQALATRDTPEHRADFFGELRSNLENNQLPARRTHRLRYFWIGPAVAAGIAAVFLASNLTNDVTPQPQPAQPDPSTATTPPRLSLASQVLAQVSEKMASVTSISGTVVFEEFAYREPSTPEQPGFTTEPSKSTTEFRLISDGDFWAKEVTDGRTEHMSFVVRTGEERQASSENVYITKNAGTSRIPMGLYRLTVLTSSLRALAHQNDASLKETTFNGRPAWQLEANTTIDLFSVGPDHYVITVDKETLFPVQVLGSRKGKPLSQTTLVDLQVNEPFTADDLTIAIPHGAEVTRFDRGHQVVPLDRVNQVVGYKAFVPGFVPDGFVLSSVTANKDAGIGGPEGSNSYNRNLVTLTYRRGLESFQVITRASANGDEVWNDPSGYEGEPPRKIDKVKLAGGSFADVTADVVTGSTSTPHLWAIGSRWLLTIEGDLGRDDLIKIAESLSSPSAADPTVNPSTTIAN